MCDDQSVLPCWNWNIIIKKGNKSRGLHTLLVFLELVLVLGELFLYSSKCLIQLLETSFPIRVIRVNKINNSFEIKTEQSFFVLCRPQGKKLWHGLEKKKTWKAEVFSKRKEVTYDNWETHKINNCEIKMSTVTNRSNTWKETMLSTAG